MASSGNLCNLETSITSVKTMPPGSFNDLRINRESLNRRLIEELTRDRPSLGAQSRATLRTALRLGGRRDLDGVTLLERSIHKAHTGHVETGLTRLAKRAIGRRRLNEDERERLVRRNVRFVTVLYTAELLEVDPVLEQCQRLKVLLESAFRSSAKGSIGAIEVEVVNTDFDGDQFHGLRSVSATVDKIATLNDLTPVWAKGSKRLALVHYHGVVLLEKPDEIGVKTVRDELSKVGLCSVLRQTEISALTEVFGERRKTLADNLFHIARYITKGGNKLVSGRITFEYKSSFKQSELAREKEIVSAHRKLGSETHREKFEEGLENPLAMSYHEVLFQAAVVDRLMSLTKDRRGYLIKT